MGLRDIALETLENFDPAKDSPNGQENIPAGEYDIVVEKAGFRVYDSGYDALVIQTKVVEGPMIDRTETINMNVDPGYKVNQDYPFLMKRNIKLISQLAFACDFDLTEDDWEDQQSLGDAFAEKAVGRQFVLKITESKNKKDPSNPYRNYEFMKYLDEDEFPF